MKKDYSLVALHYIFERHHKTRPTRITVGLLNVNKLFFYVARYCIPHLIESARKHSAKGGTGGHLILISSVGAQLLTPEASDYQTSKHAINRLCEFINADHSEDGIKSFAIHPGGVATDLAKNMPKNMHPYLVDKPELAAGFIVWLCSGQADWATGRYLSSNWDVEELLTKA